MKTSTAIRRAQRIIDSPEKWIKGPFARDKNRTPVLPTSKSAVCFCAMGAIDNVGHHKVDHSLTVGLITFNEDLETTWLDVQIAMDFIALDAEDQGD